MRNTFFTTFICVVGTYLVACIDPLATVDPSDEQDDKIAGGRLARVNEFPSVVAFISKNYRGPNCTGTLIAPKTVLTAAHCVDLAEVASILIATQSVDPFRSESIDYEVSDILLHPDYDLATVEGERYDLALVYLKEPVVGVKPMQLNRSRSVAKTGTKIIHAGFGTVLPEDAASAGALRTITQKAKTCELAEESMFGDVPGTEEIDEIPDSFYVCHGESQDLGVRQGDSGGPGMIRNASRQLVQVSVHHAIAMPDGTGYYTYDVRVSKHIKWIDANIDTPAE